MIFGTLRNSRNAYRYHIIWGQRVLFYLRKEKTGLTFFKKVIYYIQAYGIGFNTKR